MYTHTHTRARAHSNMRIQPAALVSPRTQSPGERETRGQPMEEEVRRMTMEGNLRLSVGGEGMEISCGLCGILTLVVLSLADGSTCFGEADVAESGGGGPI